MITTKPKITRKRIILAFAVALFADAIQIPITAATGTGILAVPGEMTDFVVDCFVMLITSLLLGFHWLLLPSLFVEVVPGLDLLPTWTGCVACVVALRKRERSQPAINRESEYLPATVTSNSLSFDALTLPIQSQRASNEPIDTRLAKLRLLLEQNLISQDEYTAKRQQILSDV